MTTLAEPVHLSVAPHEGPLVSELLMGVNLELTHPVSEALLSNRIRNAKFAGSADPQTGVVDEWLPFGFNMGGMHAKAIEGMFLSPSQCQMLHNYTAPYGAGIVQSGIPIRKGEILEFRIWAKVRHHPVRLHVALRAEPSRNEAGYANAEILVDASYWKRYTVDFSIEETDPSARLFLLLKETGVLLMDQVSLNAKGSGPEDPDVQEAILRLRPPVLRFPGGCMSTNHHWRMGTGPNETRPTLADPVFKGRTEYGFGTDEYLALTHLLGASLHITINVGSGTPDDATEWATYCRDWHTSRGLEPPLAYFQIGNEQYGPWETSHMTAGMYVEALRNFVPGIRRAYPNCRIIALAEPVSTGVAGRPDTPFRKEVLAQARDLADVLALNRYKGQWYDDPAEQLQNAVESVGKIQDDLDALIGEARAAGWTPRVALTEWNYWLHAAHWDGKNFYEPDDALHGIFFSGMLHALFRAAEHIEIASFYHLLNAMGLIRKSAGVVCETSIGALYRCYRSALPGRLIPLEGSALGCAHLDGLALEKEGRVSLFLRHWNAKDPIPLALDPSLGTISRGEIFSSPDCYSPMKSRPLTENKSTIILPPLSIAKIELLRDTAIPSR